MAVGLSAGSVVTVIVAGQDVLNPFGASLSERVTRALQDQGARLIVRTFTENNRSITGPTTVNYLSTVVAETTVERSGAAEVAAVIAFAFHLATGYEAAEVGISDVRPPRTGETTDLPDEPGGSPDVLGFDLGKLVESLQKLITAAPLILVGLLIVIVVIVFLFSMRVTSVGPVRAGR
jgi:hypothetical protein